MLADRDDPNEDAHGPDLTALEHRLAAWRPAAGALDRDRMLYDAGRAAAGGTRPWRLATAALLLATVGLGGLLARERMQLVHERSLLVQERAHRREAETALAARIRASRTAPAIPASVPSTPAIRPPSPDSYLVLTSRLAQGGAEAPWPDVSREPAPAGAAPRPSEPPTRSAPLRPIDIQHVLDL